MRFLVYFTVQSKYISVYSDRARVKVSEEKSDPGDVFNDYAIIIPAATTQYRIITGILFISIYYTVFNQSQYIRRDHVTNK